MCTTLPDVSEYVGAGGAGVLPPGDSPAGGLGADSPLPLEPGELLPRVDSAIQLSGVISGVSRLYPKGVSTWRVLAWILLSEANRAQSDTTTIERKLR